MTDEELILYYSERVPAAEELLAPLGLVSWAAIRLHHAVRDVLDLHLGTGLSWLPFNKTLGGAITVLVKRAVAKGDPWASEMKMWEDSYGAPATEERNAILHAIAYTTPDSEQGLMTTNKHGGYPIRVVELAHAAGHLTLASVRLGEAVERCTKETEQ